MDVNLSVWYFCNNRRRLKPNLKTYIVDLLEYILTIHVAASNIDRGVESS